MLSSSSHDHKLTIPFLLETDTLGPELGKGAFGTVELGVDLQTGEKYVSSRRATSGGVAGRLEAYFRYSFFAHRPLKSTRRLVCDGKFVSARCKMRGGGEEAGEGELC